MEKVSPMVRHFKKIQNAPSLKLTWPLKIDGWNTSFLLEWPVFRGELLISGDSLENFLEIPPW